MHLPESTLDLLQGVTDFRLGGDVALLDEKLERIKLEIEGIVQSSYKRVGNNCLVFFTNESVMQVCEDNPDTIQGVIVDDYNCLIHPEAVVIGSFLSGTAGSPARIDFDSKVFYSNVVGSHIRRSQVDRSDISMGAIDDSTISESFISGKFRNMHLIRSMARVGQINDMTETGQILGYDSRKDRPDLDGMVAYMLELRGIQISLDVAK